MSAHSFKRERPTIGVLAGWSTLEGTSPDHYRASVIKGIQSAARSRQCDLLLSWGIRRISEINKIHLSWPLVSAGCDFVPVGPWNTDGLIVFTPLASEERSLYLQQLAAERFPVLFIATGEQGPTIAADNALGIRQAMAHLVEHGHHRIAFIAGSPTDTGDSATRLGAYHAVVAEYNLEADPGLVAWGWHDFNLGRQAMNELLGSGVKFTAVLASNDNSAIGAMQAIQEAGLRIPRDIAVIGFDDQPNAAAQVPPLSSVHVPLRQIGEQALVAMYHHLVEKIRLESLLIPSRVMKRQSCGCLPQAISSAFDRSRQTGSVPPGPPAEGVSAEEKKQQIVYAMSDVLPAELRYPGGDEIRRVCTALVDSLYQSLQEENPTYFQTAITDSIQELERVDGNLEPWQEMISVLRREMTLLPLEWGHGELHDLAEDLLHQARAVVGESAQRQDPRHQYQRAVKALALNGLTARLSASMSETEVASILKSDLADVEIRHVHVQFFEAEQDDPVAWSVELGIDDGSAPRRFRSRQFPPAGLYAADEVLNVILLPLVFQDEVLGYAACDASDLGACAVIVMQLAATIKVSRLHAKVVELSLTDALTGLQNRRYFELFLKNEIIRSQRFSRNMALILVDVDHFKDYNDTYGHPAGDEALQRVGKCLSEARRSADIVARIGGDEFAIVLPETDAKGALEVSRRIRGAIASQLGLMRSLSVSIGLTAPTAKGADAELLVKQADTALYESKRTGRNRISIYTADGVVDEKEYQSGA